MFVTQRARVAGFGFMESGGLRYAHCGYTGIIRDNGKEKGNYYNGVIRGFKVWDLGFVGLRV